MAIKHRAFFVLVAIAGILMTGAPSLAGTINYTYDTMGRLTKAEYDNGVVVQYTYDKMGNRLQQVITGGSSPGVPGPPLNVAAAAGNGRATVSFTAPASNGGSAITSYRATSAPDGKWAAKATSPITVTGLTNGTPYTFTVTATNDAGTGEASPLSNSVTPSADLASIVVTPAEGTLGSELRITGPGFGTKKGKVTIGGAALKVLAWGPDAIEGTLSKVVTLGRCGVTVLPKDTGLGAITEPGAFTVKTPEILAVVPNHGGEGTPVTMTGRFLGANKGKVTIGGRPCKVTWGTVETNGIRTVQFTVPRGLVPGNHELKVVNKVGTGTGSFLFE